VQLTRIGAGICSFHCTSIAKYEVTRFCKLSLQLNCRGKKCVHMMVGKYFDLEANALF
jgi:hypothetical protein